MEQEIFEAIKDILKKDGQVNTDSFTIDSNFEELKLDSLSGLLLLHELEERFDINIENENALKIGSVKEAVKAIAELVNKKNEK